MTNQKLLDKKKTKELDNWEKEFDKNVNYDEAETGCNWGEEDIKDFISSLLQKQRTELEQQKVKVVWNDVCEQIKQEARTELLEEIKIRVDTWGGFEDDGGNLCHYDSEILEWVNDLLNKNY